MEVTAPGLPCLASSNAVLEEMKLKKLWRMTILGSSAIQTGREAGGGALESCHHLPSMNHGSPFPLCCFLCCTICFLRPATHMETWTRYTKSITPATPGISQACHIYISVSTNSAFWGGDKTLLCCKQRFIAAKRTYCGFTRQIKNSQLLFAGCPAKFSHYKHIYFTANLSFF